MNANQQMIVRMMPDMKNWTYWVEDLPQDATNAGIPLNALSNITKTSATLTTAIGTELPTLAT